MRVAIEKARQSVQLDIDTNGMVHLARVPDEQLKVHLGTAEVVLIGGIVGARGEGPLVQVTIQEPHTRLEMRHFPAGVWQESVDIRIVPKGMR
jgi:hypothetical protein